MILVEWKCQRHIPYYSLRPILIVAKMDVEFSFITPSPHRALEKLISALPKKDSFFDVPTMSGKCSFRPSLLNGARGADYPNR
jgi:hypothetical protein